EPVVAPTLDIVLGCYYMTEIKPNAKGAFEAGPVPRGIYSSFDEAKMAHAVGVVDLHAPIRARDVKTVSEAHPRGELVETSVGRILFNEVIPAELGFRNVLFDKKAIKELVSEASHTLPNDVTAEMVDQMKNVGFDFATRSGISISMNDLRVPEEKEGLLIEADKQVGDIEEQFDAGLITEEERDNQTISIWRGTTDKVQKMIQNRLEEYGGVYIMAVSGAKGNISQISQMAGMRGLMSDPAGRIIPLPVRSSFREGLSVLEYFISTHGARKGLADTALRTADSGYLTRRLIDVAQDVIIVEDDCGTTAGIWVGEPQEKGLFESLAERIIGRYTAADAGDPNTGEVIIERGNEIMDEHAAALLAAGIDKVYVRSALTCSTRRGICARCYGRDLSRGRFVLHGEAVGIVAAQSIGEPGTQLTMRTFHTGGVAGLDITSGLPRVEELFEARVPKGAATIAEIDGTAELIREGDRRILRITSVEMYQDDYTVPKGMKLMVKDGQEVESGTIIAMIPEKKGAAAKVEEKPAGKVKKPTKEEIAAATALVNESQIVARTSGQISINKGNVSIMFEERESRDYGIPASARLRVHDGDYIHAGQALTEGPLNPQDILRIQGPEAVQLYLVEEVQKVYRSQGVTINDKHIEVIVRQMLRRVRVDQSGDSNLLPGELVDRFKFESETASVLAAGGEPATAQPVLLGITKASLNTESFLAAASFQETTRVLTEAAISGQVDRLLGLKENVIIGKLIPARAEIEVEALPAPQRLSDMALPSGFSLRDGDDDADLDEWTALGDLDAEDLEEPLEDEGTLGGDLRVEDSDELEDTEIVEGELVDAGVAVEELPLGGGTDDDIALEDINEDDTTAADADEAL
ncbi:MAG: DNA-directed RNA polymerase subunit beta', partial [Chloroflexota bacterium]